ncbi:hypothetical protein FOA52_004461 [Chlamydomonas sp. UWO 241]|nr:hypothetical protein FOA52_004461 [Chlamydomonas sp. UWO 241]
MENLCDDGNPDTLAAIVAAGAIPELVKLLGPGSLGDLQKRAAGALWTLAFYAANAATIAAAGAIPALLQLLRPGSTTEVQEMVAGALQSLTGYGEDSRGTGQPRCPS